MLDAQKQAQLLHLAQDILKDTHSLTNEQLVQSLRAIIRLADWKYYVASESLLTDYEYDFLYKHLLKIETEHPELLSPDSPTQRVAQGLSERAATIKHLVPMLSLENTYNADDLRAWHQRCLSILGIEQIEYCIEPKYDGASISLVYEHNRLKQAATRGDGIQGEDISINAKQIKSVPLFINLEANGIEQIEIRGEVVMNKENFKNLNTQREKEGLSLLANPRNAASGSLRILDPQEVAQRKLSAIFYHISYVQHSHNATQHQAIHSHKEALENLYQWGLPSPAKELKLFTDIEALIQYCEAFESQRDLLPYEIDGLVIKVNRFDQQKAMGMTAHHPRWAVAYKFKARQSSSKLLDVIFQVGRTGSITPVAKIEPVLIGGATISSVSLFNEENVREKDLKIGDTVLVERAGDVIPYIVKSLPEARLGTERTIQFPSHCPICQQELEKPEEEAVWRCINIDCPAQVVERMIHFCSKDAMDIRGMGIANVQKFYELGIINNIADLYKINWDKVASLEGFKEKSIQNLKTAIEQSKQQELYRLLFGLGIRHIGETTAKNLSRAIQNLEALYTWGENDYLALEDFGPKMAKSLVHFFSLDENKKLLQELKSLGLNFENLQKEKLSEGNLQGNTFLFTGTLSKMKRSEAEKLVEQLGGQILSGVSSKLHYLVCGEDAGSKLEKAKKLGNIQILNEQEFLDLIQQA